MPLDGMVRAVRIPLEGSVSATDACLLLRDDAHPFALSGGWAGGGALAGSEPVEVATPDADPFALLDRQPRVTGPTEDMVGGGWFGYLGYGLGARLEPVPPPPPRPVLLPPFALAFYDHLLRLDAAGRWWFEALWSERRDAELRRRLNELRDRLARGVRARTVRVGPLAPTPPGAAGHLAAVEACRERIAAGEIFQANICLRLEGRWKGDPVDLYARGAGALSPRHGALVAGPWGALCSLSPELFLRRRGRQVTSEPIKGTAPREASASAALAASAKDRAENVMIVDLMRNDLGRVCEYGSVEVPALYEPRPAPGVWHLVSTVTGTLRPGVGDGDVVRASFPPGSVTGAPKIQSMRVIAELEASGREAYTGAIGYVSPLAGMELNVAIRTLETRGERVWLGAGGGIVADSEPQRELEESLLKARPLVVAVGASLAEPGRAPTRSAGPRALAGVAERPDPAHGVFETLLARDSEPVDADAHLSRLARSVESLYGQELPDDLPDRIRWASRAGGRHRLRVLMSPGPGRVATVEVESTALTGEAQDGPVSLAPALLPGGLGEHKWRDRRLLAELERRTGGVPLVIDLDGDVLEAAWANVFVVEAKTLTTPPLDGRLLGGTVRARLLALAPALGLETREEPLSLERLAAADEVLLSSSVQGLRAALPPGGRRARFETGVRLRELVTNRARGPRPPAGGPLEPARATDDRAGARG